MAEISNLRKSRSRTVAGESSRHTRLTEKPDQLTEALLRTHGELMSGPALYRILGFKSAGGFRLARNREHGSPIPVFQIPQRRGYFAMTRDVADWLYRQRASAMSPKEAPMNRTD